MSTTAIQQTRGAPQPGLTPCAHTLPPPPPSCLDKQCVDESKSYGPQLLARFAGLLAQVGPGQHQWSFRLAPRGVVSVSPELIFGLDGEYHKGMNVQPDKYAIDDTERRNRPESASPSPYSLASVYPCTLLLDSGG